MLKSGNGKTATCINNLLSMERGEVPLDQLRGIREDLTDMPAAVVEPFYRANVLWLVENYEPRAEAGEIALKDGDTEGNFKTNAALN